MGTKGLFKIFRPKQKVFYDLPEAMTANLVIMASQLKLVTEETTEAALVLSMDTIARLEQQNSDLSRRIFTELGANFITPFDREDIYHLASVLKEITSYIYGCSKRIRKYGFVQTINGYSLMSGLIVESCTHLHQAVTGLRKFNHQAPITNALQTIRKIERQADDMYYEYIEDLFTKGLPTNELIKAAEIYQQLEDITDKCYDASKKIKVILVKTA